MHKILDCLARLLAPILAHTAEEVYENMTAKTEPAESIHLITMPKPDKSVDWQTDEPKWQKLMNLRDEVLKELEGLRQKQIIASNQESTVTISTDNLDLINVVENFGVKNFAALCIVSEVKLNKSKSDKLISAQKSPHKKCQRCWNYWPSVGTDVNYPDLCDRCAKVIKSL
jgi:isoleucyl-tRNA synthetase